MEQLDQFSTLLSLIERPAFCTHDGMVVFSNAAAQKLQIAKGTALSEFLAPGDPVPQPPKNGYLYLPISVFGSVFGASVLDLQDKLLFVLEDDNTDARLQALALASQQLRLPLSGAMTSVEQLFERKDLAPDPELQTQMAQLQKRLFQLLRLVNNMSDAYQYNLPGSTKTETVNLTSFFYQVLEAAKHLLADTGYTLRFTVPRQAIFSQANREMLERAVYNLISNAVKFSPKGSTITASLTQQGSTLHFTLRDDGEGVCRNIIGDIFSRYARQPGIEDGRYGLGLGMILVRTAALAHGGTLLMEQPEGQGLKITMTIPLRQRVQDTVRSQILSVDYAGERDHGLLELSDVLPATLFNEIN